LIAVKNFFYVSELSTKNLSLVERECVKNKCDDFSLYVSAIHLAFYVEDIVAITDNSELQDVISILGDFNLPKVKWKVNVTSDLESDRVDAINNWKCKRLREKFVSLREKYQKQHDQAYDDYRARIEEDMSI
jgi:hypothetical protein